MSYEGCTHYRRRALLQCPLPTCSAWVSCRFCHDEIFYDKGDPKAQHKFERSRVVNIRCTGCSLEQPPQRECRGCGLVLGAYFCALCVLYDNEGEKKGLWHCSGCGLCRAGGKHNFFHCDGCGSCLNITMQGGNHKCSGLLKADCPFCKLRRHPCAQNQYNKPKPYPLNPRQAGLEDMWSSTLPCGFIVAANCGRPRTPCVHPPPPLPLAQPVPSRVATTRTSPARRSILKHTPSPAAPCARAQ